MHIVKTSLGIGLGAAKKSVDELEICTNQNEGTEVILKKFLPIPEEQIEYGVVSVADQRYSINGDVYLIKEYDGDKVLLAVIDGTGEGFRANSAALIVKEFISDNYILPLEDIIYNCHEIDIFLFSFKKITMVIKPGFTLFQIMLKNKLV